MNTTSKSNHIRGVIFAFLLLMIPLSLNAQIVDVSIPGFNFDPADLAVETGATVRWTNNHTVNHTSTSLDGIWDSGTLAPGESYSYTFNNPGYYEYDCTFHPSMTGVIRVLELFYSIPDLYANMQAVEGQVVNVLGEFSEGNDSKLVTNYARYISRELMPQHTIIFIEGAMPPLDYWYGGMVLVTGTVSLIPNPNPIYPDDTVYISIDATGYELINEGKFDPYLPKDEGEKFDINQPRDCDSCKFGILISGGGDAANNHPGFWEDIENLYKHKVNNENYCPQNVKVIYYE
ncbi:MAG: hypothetical protein GF310_12750, partial [candidate division Zixibacteria bacterium]|nr:hypothetical protein [candidate division Zixibacteria bacterium]